MISQNLIEKRLIQNLLKLESCLLKTKENPKKTHYFIGFRKGIFLLNIETSFKNYFKILNIVQGLKKTKKAILFVGCPSGLEKKILKSIFEPNFFINLKERTQDILFSSSLLKKKVCFIITYCDKICPALNACFIKSIPTAKFIFEIKNNILVDYAIPFNLYSKGVIGLFLYLLHRSS